MSVLYIMLSYGWVHYIFDFAKLFGEVRMDKDKISIYQDWGWQGWKIQRMLMENVNDGDGVIKNMAKLMMLKFQKYWDEYSIVLAFGAILDPRMKLETLSFCFKKSDPLTWESKVEKIKGNLYNLFAE